MLHLHSHLRKRLLQKAGVEIPLPEESKAKLNYPDLAESEWSDRFETLMRNRLIMGAYRYGTMREQEAKAEYNYAKEADRRMKIYLETGNTEYLVDAANLCLLEFEIGSKHPNKHFESVDDGTHSVKEK